jgi:hypothetical protein
MSNGVPSRPNDSDVSSSDSATQFADLAHNITDDEINTLEESFLLKARAATEKGEPPDEFLDARWILRAYQQRRSGDSLQIEAQGVREGQATEGRLAVNEQAHRHKLETWRHVVAITLVMLLFLVIIIGMFVGKEAAIITQAAAPLAGLAGIAVGWLFGTVQKSASDTKHQATDSGATARQPVPLARPH